MLFSYPNGHDPLPDCKHAAELLLSSPEEFKRRVRRHMQEVSLLAYLSPSSLLTLPFKHGTYIPTPAAPEEPGASNRNVMVLLVRKRVALLILAWSFGRCAALVCRNSLNDVALVHGVGNKHERRDLTAALPLKSCDVIAPAR